MPFSHTQQWSAVAIVLVNVVNQVLKQTILLTTPWLKVKQRVFLSHLYIKCIFLPRQARDKHRESTQKRQLFCCRHRANGTILANGTKVHTYYDAELGTNSTGYDGTLGADWDSISW